ncbi:MAG TPA: 2-dehydropantoate 2-reductase [Gaiellaceae bacterium]|nr:2-dehydropantoate 2-reductase [Gaiellaceae bacterium]
MRIGVVGAGAVGGFFGARLAQAGADVAVLARGSHLDAIREHGLRVRGPEGDIVVHVDATSDPREVGSCDAVLFCVKAYDAEAAASDLAPLMGPETAIVPLLNGIDHLDMLASAVGREHVLGGMAAVFSERVAPGVVVFSGGPDTITFGELDGSRTARAEALLEACRAAGIADDLSADILSVMWRKLAFICAQAGLTAVTRLPLGEIRDSPAAFALYRRVLDEVLTVARAEDVSIREGTVDQLLGFAQTLEPHVFSSLHDDLVAGRRMELEALHGSVVRHAERHALSVPACRAIYALLAPWAARNAATLQREAARVG